MKKKHIALAAIFIFLAIIALMIIRGRKGRYEGDEASELLTEINDQLQSIGKLWTNIKSNLENMKILSVEYDIPEIRNQINNMKTAREDIKEMKSDLESIRNQNYKKQNTK